MDDGLGMHAEHTTYSDLDTEKLNAIPETVLHRNVDIPIIEADKAGFVKTYLIVPGEGVLFISWSLHDILPEYRNHIWLSLRTTG